MDHSSAHFMEFTAWELDKGRVATEITQSGKEGGQGKGENLMHNKEQHQQAEYYKRLGEKIKDYDEVLLFGPTNAKAELVNTFKNDHHFDKIRIYIEQTDKLTGHQQLAFARTYFSNPKRIKK